EGSRPRRLERLLEGSGVVLVGVSLVLTATLLAAPRATAPLILPLPEPHRALLARDRAADQERAERAKARGLSYASRAVGEAMRRFGVASVSKGANAEAALKDLRV